MKKLEIGIIGGAGYTAGELIRLLLHHQETNINFVYSTSNAGNKLYKVHQDLIGDTEINFTSKINTDVDVLFLCFLILTLLIADLLKMVSLDQLH